MLAYPYIDPVAFSVGPLAVRWYGIAYILGFYLGAKVAFPQLIRLGMSKSEVWDYVTFLMLAILIGGRLGYVLIYDPGYYVSNPLQVVAIWQGGMSYHGAAFGTVFATAWVARAKKLPVWGLLDALGWASTIGLGLGRIANFINGELVGRVTGVPWGKVFPNQGPFPRHPSQLYEAFGEGLVLWIILALANRNGRFQKGQLFAIYLMGYGAIRFGIEFFREPDSQVGYWFGALTTGQVLCTAMVVGGAIIFRLRADRFKVR